MSRRKISKIPAVVEGDEQQTKVDADPPFVTPSTWSNRRGRNVEENPPSRPKAKRTLFPVEDSGDVASLVTPLPTKRKIAADSDSKKDPPAKRRLIFGKFVDVMVIQGNVKHVYKIIKSLTGSIGGNSNVGPIYGELTMSSMQKMVNLMVEHCDLNRESRFIDVGSGIGKPNIHVAQYPGVSFSCGVEVEHSRWVLGMTCLKAVLDTAEKHSHDSAMIDAEATVLGNTLFLQKDIMEARSFDPFTHVYMFSIGFPPSLWLKLADIWNQSQARHLICYHGPKDIIQIYEFDAELVAQIPTSMHGSKEGHMGYIYKRKLAVKRVDDHACDPMFVPAWDVVKSGLRELHQHVSKQIADVMGSGRKTRSKK